MGDPKLPIMVGLLAVPVAVLLLVVLLAMIGGRWAMSPAIDLPGEYDGGPVDRDADDRDESGYEDEYAARFGSVPYQEAAPDPRPARADGALYASSAPRGEAVGEPYDAYGGSGDTAYGGSGADPYGTSGDPYGSRGRRARAPERPDRREPSSWERPAPPAALPAPAAAPAPSRRPLRALPAAREDTASPRPATGRGRHAASRRASGRGTDGGRSRQDRRAADQAAPGTAPGYGSAARGYGGAGRGYAETGPEQAEAGTGRGEIVEPYGPGASSYGSAGWSHGAPEPGHGGRSAPYGRMEPSYGAEPPYGAEPSHGGDPAGDPPPYGFPSAPYGYDESY